MTFDGLSGALRALLTIPRAEQPAAIRVLLNRLERPAEPEEWNTQFGPRSVFSAWTASTVARGAYRANGRVLRPFLDHRRDWRAIEVGGGDGSLWKTLLSPDDKGHLIVVDPAKEAHRRVAEVLPRGVEYTAIETPIEALGALPEADAVICSMTLHHVAGRDAVERSGFGLSGPGKSEVLHAFRKSVRARQGMVIINEADVHCELDLEPGDPVLVDQMVDSYVRRCATSLLHDIEGRKDAEADLRNRWAVVIRDWCLAQIEMAHVPREERDVYELDVCRWLALFAAVGLECTQRRFTDDYRLFCQYILA